MTQIDTTFICEMCNIKALFLKQSLITGTIKIGIIIANYVRPKVIKPMDDLHYRLIFDLAKCRRKKRNSRKLLKNSKIWSRILVKYGKYSLAKFANFLISLLCYTCGNCYHF